MIGVSASGMTQFVRGGQHLPGTGVGDQPCGQAGGSGGPGDSGGVGGTGEPDPGRTGAGPVDHPAPPSDPGIHTAAD